MLALEEARRMPGGPSVAAAHLVRRASRWCMTLHRAQLGNGLNFVSSVGQKSVGAGRSRVISAGRLTWLLAACFVSVHARVDPDLWGHVRFGLDTLTNGRLSITDPYSFTQDVPWINHEWLSEIAQAIAYRGAGVLGLMLLKAVVLGTAFLLLARQTAGVPVEWRWWMLAAAIVGVAPAAFTMRPQLWTLLFVPLVWLALNRGWWFAIPLVFGVWANLHGGWIVGMGVGGLWLVGRTIDRRGRMPIAAAAALAAGLLATLINPYGWQLWRFLFMTVRPWRDITEWRPLWEQDDFSSAIVWLVVAAVIVVPTVVRRRSALTWTGMLPAAWLGVSSLFVARLVPLFAEVALLGLAVAWTAEAQMEQPLRTQSIADSQPPRRPARFLIVDAAAIAAIVLVNLASQTRCLTIGRDAWTPDLQAASALDSTMAQGRLVLPFNWGQYAIWHFGPRLRVSIDGRRETVYSQRMLEVQAATARGLPAGIEFLSQTRPEYVWLSTTAGAPALAWLKSNNYRVDVHTDRSFVATRADLPPLAMSAPKSRCFP